LSMWIDLELESEDEISVLDTKIFLEALCDFITEHNKNWKIRALRVVNKHE